MIKNKKFDDFFEVYINTQIEAEQYSVLQNFMLSCTFKELLAWDEYLESKSNLKEIVARGLTKEDHTFFKEQFAKFDDLEAVLKARKAA